ncbi:type I Zorya anti-phage system protein ZorC [Aeromonas sobria]|uniref:type I Zorya anti-phage system protein ZorC n=1 Tax=Aeromonas sobria TaxID=646 RepID=UPI001117B0F0|nr:type I Zorya anti-phage system protein ZorC [Aeromonas sobria]TNH96860.1 hypothetical protein CF137_06295 [Aeromonas sobria]
MVDAISRLTAILESSVERVNGRYQERTLHSFSALQRARSEVEARFDQAEAAPEPPKEKRHAALAAFLRNEPLTRRQWRLVYAGLVDCVEAGKQLLDDEKVFPRVSRHVSAHIDSRELVRRDWTALCFSYFGYEAIEPEKSQNWQQLRTYIRDGYRVLRNPEKLKAWMRVVDEHQELFQSEAGLRLGQQIFEGTVTDLTQLQTLAQIPTESWLWHQIVAVVQKRIAELDEAPFLARLPALLALMAINNRRHSDEIMAACLTRYHGCSCHVQPQANLIQAGLEIWGNPQLKSDQNRWRHHVAKPVCDMVGAWLAKQDLQHFFSLLKGEGEVDQARLFYWLRFADQMSYTRIVMGRDAQLNRDGEFVRFRDQNKGRLGDLSGGSPADNAVIMQIGDYIFVEFSHTGNACYVYRANSCGFNPDVSTLHLTHDLKQKNLAKGRWIHVPKPLKPDAMEGWQQKYDDELRLLGIVPNPQGANQLWNRVVKPKIVKPSVPSFQAPLGNNPESKSRVVNTPADRTVVIHSGGKGKVDFALLLEQLGENLRHYTDHREKGGAFHIEIKQRNTDDILLLRRNGFVVKTGSPFMFWKK